MQTTLLMIKFFTKTFLEADNLKMRKIKAFFDWSSPTTKHQEGNAQIGPFGNPVGQTLQTSKKNIFDTFKKGLLYCWIEPLLAPKRDNFTFDFILFIDQGDITREQPFSATFDQIQKVINIAKNYDDCFAIKRFPSSMFIPSFPHQLH